tara:strand:- start:252 stop:581 length:330 start_codon:yes stop_codon:yes gene_type:complete
LTDNKKKEQKIYTLMAEVGRSKDDGLPKTSSGAALMCYASGIDEAEAVRETIAILKVSGMSPLSVSGYGTIEERIDQGHDIDDHEYDLMDKATKENSVVISQITPFFED